MIQLQDRPFVEISAGTFNIPPRGYGGVERFAFGLAKSVSMKIQTVIIDFSNVREDIMFDEVRVMRLRNSLRLVKGRGLIVYSWNAMTASLVLFSSFLRHEIRLERPILFFYNGLEYGIFRRLQMVFIPSLRPLYVFRLPSPKWMHFSLVPWWQRILAVPTELYAISTASAVVFESDVVRDSLLEYHKMATKSYVLPNAVDTDYFSKEKYRAKSRPYGILYAARIKRQKNQLAVIRAMALVVKVVPEAELLLLGDPDEDDYDKIVRTEVSKLGIESHVKFHPPASIEELNMVRSEYLVQLVYSDYTGFDVAVGESLAMSAACIFSDIPTLRGIAENGVNCILVPPNNPEKLANAMVDLLSDPQKAKRLAAEARRIAVSRLSWQALGQGFLDFLSKLKPK